MAQREGRWEHVRPDGDATGVPARLCLLRCVLHWLRCRFCQATWTMQKVAMHSELARLAAALRARHHLEEAMAVDGKRAAQDCHQVQRREVGRRRSGVEGRLCLRPTACLTLAGCGCLTQLLRLEMMRKRLAVPQLGWVRCAADRSRLTSKQLRRCRPVVLADSTALHYPESRYGSWP